MADNDIYNSKGKYERFKQEIKTYLQPPEKIRKYQIKNPANLKHFQRLLFKLDARDGSYVRRLRLCHKLLAGWRR